MTLDTYDEQDAIIEARLFPKKKVYRVWLVIMDESYDPETSDVFLVECRRELALTTFDESVANELMSHEFDHWGEFYELEIKEV